MISDSLWKLPESSQEHLGIVLSYPRRFPLHAVLCSHSGVEGEMGEAQRPAPNCFEPGTRLCFDVIRALDPADFHAKSGLVRFKWHLTPEELAEVREHYMVVRTTTGLAGFGAPP